MKFPKMTMDEFVYEYCDPRWCDLDVRPKTARAFQKLCERLPGKVWLDLPRIHLFVPSAWHRGVTTVMIPSDDDAAFIYLAPYLERESQVNVDFTVAHEFAHALLHHHTDDKRMTMREVKGRLPQSADRESRRPTGQEGGFVVPTYRTPQKAGK